MTLNPSTIIGWVSRKIFHLTGKHSPHTRLGELRLTMRVFVNWKDICYSPKIRGPLSTYVFDNPPSVPTIRAYKETVKAQGNSMTSPLFICPTYHVIKVHEESVDEEWFTLFDKLRLDAECFGIYRSPFDRPFSVEEIVLIKHPDHYLLLEDRKR